MKPLIIFISFSSIFCNCIAQPSKKILDLLARSSCNGAITTKKFFSKRGSLCSDAVFLNSDYTFTEESGCEERSSISMGTWKMQGDSIELSVFDTLRIPLLCSITYGKSIRNPKKETTFIIKDKTGQPVENFLILPFGKGAKYIYTYKGITQNPSADATNFDVFETDKSGRIKVNYSRYDSLTFSKLGSLTNRNIMFSTKNLPTYLTLKLNLNKEAFYYPVVNYYNPDIKKIRYKLSTNQLVNSDSRLQMER